jgi:hypothetical protein
MQSPTNLLLESLDGDADVKLVRVGLNGALLHLSNGLLDVVEEGDVRVRRE